MSHNTKENILFAIIIAIFVFIGGPELWSFDRSAAPDFCAHWSLSDTTPELVPLPKTIMRPNRVSNDTQLRLYKQTNEVVLYSPGTNRAFVIPCADYSAAITVYNDFAIRYSYYIAADRTYANHKGKNSEVAAAETFLDYLYKRMNTPINPQYGNRYLDSLTIEVWPTEFIPWVESFDPNSPFIEHEYATDRGDMWNELNKVYNKDTILNKHWAVFDWAVFD